VKRALLIAASMHERLGIESDLRLMTEVLTEYGFDPIEVAPRPATRERMLGALSRLAAQTRPDDTVVIYYTGHGGLARFRGEIGGITDPQHVWRYLVPENPDAHSAREGRFAGVLDAELGHIIGRELASKCANVTVILECCFAGGMFAPHDVALARRVQTRGLVDVVTFKVPEQLCGQQPWSVSSRQLAEVMPSGQAPVIVAATAEARKAFETKQDGSAADFTKVLVDALRRHRGRPITWGRLIDRVCREVQLYGGRISQAPHVIGPRGRTVFGVTTSDISREFEVVVGSDGALWLFAGSLHGLHDGDEFELLEPDEDIVLATARIRTIEPARARLHVDTESLGRQTPGASLVASLRASAEPTSVRLVGDSPTMLELRQAIAASSWLRASDMSSAASLVVTCDGGCLRVDGPGLARNPVPEQARDDLPADGESPVPWVVADLEALARSRSFVATCAHAAPVPEQIRFNLLVDDQPVSADGVVRLGQRVRLAMTYAERYTGETLFLNVVNIGLDGRPYLLNGRLFNRGGINLFSEDPDHAIGQSFSLNWPSEVPRAPRRESLYFVLTSAELDLDALTSIDPDAERTKPVARNLKTLARLLQPVQLYVHRLDFILSP
jgi:hypothetical protein